MEAVVRQLQEIGIRNVRAVYHNLSPARLVEHAVARKEGVLVSNGALSVTTGAYTGRSPQDRYIVDEPSTSKQIAWGAVNRPMSPEVFAGLRKRLAAYLQNREVFVFDGFAGTDPNYRLPIRIVNERAWQNLFVHQLFVRGTEAELKDHSPEFTVVSVPGFKAEPELDGTGSEVFIVLNLKEKMILIGGTEYAGEMKKSIFTVLNYLLPEAGVFPMHCSANQGQAGDVALFFGLSGTGKTTLSADPERFLIGDDEHGWTDEGVFNFEGGCYAKCIGLAEEKEPQIWNAIRFGSVLENVVVDEKTREPDYEDGSLTENTRVAYPVDYIPNALVPGRGGHPNAVVFLTADAFGVLPPIAKLTEEQAMYHFLSGYTSKLAGTERGVTSPEATFSTCFGAPFLPRPPMEYARLLGEKIRHHQVDVFLINTGWSGGPYGVGERIRLDYTRAMVRAALNGSLTEVEFRPDPIFQVLVPSDVPGVPAEILQPRATWEDQEAYERQASELASRFVENFRQFADVPTAVLEAGPRLAAGNR